MKNSMLPYWLTLMVVLGVAYGGWHVWKNEQAKQARIAASIRSTAAVETGPLSEFTLVERSGQPFRSQDMRGKVWVTSFFFTSCPNICLTMSNIFSSMQEIEELKDVYFVSISCDPDNDTPEVLATYADRFNADPEHWLFCTGDFDYVKRVGEDFMKLTVLEKVHKEYAVIIDRAGKIRGRFNVIDANDRAEARDLLVECLAETAPQIAASADAESLARQVDPVVP